MPNFFTKLFGFGNDAKVQPVASDVESTKENTETSAVPEMPSVQHTDYKPGVVTINLHTGRPIDAIYLYIKQDNEQLGYNDAIRFHNLQAMTEGVTRIKNKLKTLFDQVNMKYQDKATKLRRDVKTYTDMFYLESAAESQEQLDRVLYHIQEIERLRKDLESNAENVRTMIETYEKGFKHGMLDIMGGGIHSVAPTDASSNDFAVIEG